NDALIRSHRLGVLTGSPVVVVPKHLDDVLWRLGGYTPVATKVVERASTAEELLRAGEMVLLWIKCSWRNSEAIEQRQGYVILAMLIGTKLGYSPQGTDNIFTSLVLTGEERDELSFRLLSLLLDFVGYNHANPLDSFIV